MTRKAELGLFGTIKYSLAEADVGTGRNPPDYRAFCGGSPPGPSFGRIGGEDDRTPNSLNIAF